VGGFIGRANGELLARSYEVFFLVPFCRNHKVIDGYDQEPWRFGKYYEDIIRKYLKLRYRLMPYLYTTLEEASRTGVPLFRPLVLNYQEDYNTLNLDDEFMVGDSLLVAPVTGANQTSRMVYLPAGVWYDFWTNKKYTGGTMIRADAPLETVPMYVRAGDIIPTGPEMSYVGEKPTDPITFMIYPSDNRASDFTLYEDDGTTQNYRQPSEAGVRRTTIFLNPSGTGKGYVLRLTQPRGSYKPAPRSFIFSFKSVPALRTVTIDGKTLGLMKAGEQRDGWYREGDDLSVRLADDGKEHIIRLNER
jgi:alpha-glucosidase